MNNDNNNKSSSNDDNNNNDDKYVDKHGAMNRLISQAPRNETATSFPIGPQFYTNAADA